MARLELYAAAVVAVQGLTAAVGTSSLPQGMGRTLVLSPCLLLGAGVETTTTKKGRMPHFCCRKLSLGLDHSYLRKRRHHSRVVPFHQRPDNPLEGQLFPRGAQAVPKGCSGKAPCKGESSAQHIWIWPRTSAPNPPAAKHRACTEGTANSPARGTASDPAQN